MFLIIAQGAVLTGWIVIQVVMLHGIHYLHLIFGGIGLTLIACGLIERKEQTNQIKKQDRLNNLYYENSK
jgi:heme/copper-type cytochrome/quinol oxidase subunit 3